MATYEVTYNVQLTDVNGDSATAKIVTTAADTTTLAAMATLATGLAADIQACSNAKVTGISASPLFSRAQISAGTAPPPANATYPSVTDGAHLNFRNSAGGTRGLTIPAPLLTDFIANSNTVNAGDANISALISQIEGITDIDGSTNLYNGGVKTGRRARLRATRKHL